MKITANFRLPGVDLARYRQALKETLAQAITEAAFEWIQAVTEAVPSWSGASRATMQHLASKAGFQVEINIVSPPGIGDRTSLGLQNATGDILTDKADEGIVSFYYTTSLPHLIWNEFNNAMITPDPGKWRTPARHDGDHTIPPLHKPGPYGFQEKGAKAVKKVFDQVRLPNPGDFMRSGKSLKV